MLGLGLSGEPAGEPAGAESSEGGGSGRLGANATRGTCAGQGSKRCLDAPPSNRQQTGGNMGTSVGQESVSFPSSGFPFPVSVPVADGASK